MSNQLTDQQYAENFYPNIARIVSNGDDHSAKANIYRGYFRVGVKDDGTTYLY